MDDLKIDYTERAFHEAVNQAAVWDGTDVGVGDHQLIARSHWASIRVMRVERRSGQEAYFSFFQLALRRPSRHRVDSPKHGLPLGDRERLDQL